jgi:hypothetical protein
MTLLKRRARALILFLITTLAFAGDAIALVRGAADSIRRHDTWYRW